MEECGATTLECKAASSASFWYSCQCLSRPPWEVGIGRGRRGLLLLILGCKTASARSSEERGGRSWRLLSSKVRFRRMRLRAILMLSSESLRKFILMARTPAVYGDFFAKVAL